MYLSRLTFDLTSAAAHRDLSDGPDAEPGRFRWGQVCWESGEVPILLMQLELEPQFDISAEVVLLVLDSARLKTQLY